MIKITSKIGRSTVQIEAEGLKKLMIIQGFLNEVPDKCGNCKSDNVILNGKKNAGYEFYGCLCKDCGHELKCGQRKEDGGLFWKLEDGWVAPYRKGEGGGGGGGGGRPAPQPQPDRHDEDDDIPF